MKVKLHSSLDKAGLGFIDPEGQKIRAKNPGKGEIIDVENTTFVQEKIGTGELIAIEEKSSAPELSEKDRKALFKDAKVKLDELRKRIKNEDLSAELRMGFDETLDMIEKAIKDEAVDLLFAADEKLQALIAATESVKK